MKKFIILTLVCLLLLSSIALASKSRFRSLGSSIAVIDDSNIEAFPSRLIEFSNLAYADFDDYNYTDSYNDVFYGFGMNWMIDNDSKWTMGMYFETLPLSDWGSDELPFGYNQIPSFGFSNDYLNSRITFYYARPVGNNNLGFKFMYHNASSKYSNDTPYDDEESLKNMNFTLGLTEGSGQWDAAVMFGTGSFTNDTLGAPVNEADGISQFGFMGRYFKVQNPNYTLVPHAGFMTSKFGWTSTDEAEEFKGSLFDLGCGVNFTPSNNVLAVFDFGLAFSSYEEIYTDKVTPANSDEYKETFNTLPYFILGLDAEVFKWLDVRFAVRSDWHNEKDEYSVNSQVWEYGYAYNETSVGLGFHWNRLHIDTEANPEFFLYGPDFLSGADEDMAFSMSAVYEL
ncbi:MAG: hypothetical protein DWP97_02675 [Calditrichaeota bacterium]|nr:MAG: hypothetical protein DWP97_02675 [Calditrichota bacterium]